jgi:hypothetical protein
MLKERARKAAQEVQKKQDQQRTRAYNAEKKEMYVYRVITRRAERAQAKEVKELEAAGQVVPLEKLIPIPDPEAIWKADQAKLQAQEAEQKRLQALEQEDVEITIDTTGN